jgi:transposase
VATVRLAYRFALDPTPAQQRALRSHAGAARFAWNWGLARCKERCAAEDLNVAAMKREPGTPPEGKTGTAARQRAAAT